MTVTKLKKQRGAVLAFSLVMLLLLTLVSINMIQQNKSQITIAANTGQQVQTFASVESALIEAQRQVDWIRYINNSFSAAHNHCQVSDADHQLNQGDNITAKFTNLGGALPVNSGAITATVYSVACMNDYDDALKTGHEFQCFYKDSNTNGSGNRLPNGVEGGFRDTSLSTTPDDNKAACTLLNNAGPATYPDGTAGIVNGWSPGHPGIGCQMELYTLNVTFLDSSNASRTVQSKFQVNCANDKNMVNAPGT